MYLLINLFPDLFTYFYYICFYQVISFFIYFPVITFYLFMFNFCRFGLPHHFLMVFKFDGLIMFVMVLVVETIRISAMVSIVSFSRAIFLLCNCIRGATAHLPRGMQDQCRRPTVF